jgi:two-component system CitB family sensor kinase
MRRRSGEPSVARQVLLLQVCVVLTLVVASMALAAYDARRDARVTATERAVAVARSVADSPTVLEAVGRPDTTAVLQPYAERVRRDAAVDFVVVMTTDGIRWTHPNADNIGRQFVGGLGGAPEGRVFTEETEGTLGPSVRAVVPVFDGAEVVALVSVGITVSAIDRQLRDDLALVLLAAIAVLSVGLAGTALVSRRLSRQTHGLGAGEITRMYEYYTAVLGAVREGLVLLDTEGRVALVNDEATRLLGLPSDVVGRLMSDLGLAPGLVTAALGRTAEADDIYLAGDRVLVVSSAPARWEGHDVGAVVSLRDATELRAVTGELDVVRGLSEALRAQNHESANRLHTMVSLIEMGRVDEAVSFATDELRLAQALTDQVVGAVGDPVVEALLLGKSADAAERGITLTVEGALPDVEVPARDLVTILGNLVDNAFEAVVDTPVGARQVRVALGGDPAELVVSVEDSGTGLDGEALTHALDRGWSTKGSRESGRGVGLALVAQVARRHGGGIEIGRSPLGGAEFTVTLHPAEVPS